MTETPAIRLDNLTKVFGRGKKKLYAVKNASFEVKAGQVYGFLGPNGAGKTTAIRMILDLLRPTSGHAFIYGEDPRQSLDALRNVGMLVEGPSFYPYLSGFKNLRVLARTHGHYDKERILSLLEQVNLAERAQQRYKKYSLGMKQRLGLAAALLHDPELLILDEPTNGLDPAGIQEMRRFIRDLVDHQGKTVFLSSHMLNEVEQVCDRVAIIRKGEIIREGTVSELVEGQSQVQIEVTPVEKAKAVLSEHWALVANGHHAENGNVAPLIVESSQSDIPHIVRKLVENEIEVYGVSRHRQSLEAVFLNITGGEEAHEEAE